MSEPGAHEEGSHHRSTLALHFSVSAACLWTSRGMWCLCDTPELWRGAAGLCARVRACACATESLHTYSLSRGGPVVVSGGKRTSTWSVEPELDVMVQCGVLRAAPFAMCVCSLLWVLWARSSRYTIYISLMCRMRKKNENAALGVSVACAAILLICAPAECER